MSKDEAVTKDLIETLQDGKEGFEKAAERLDKDDNAELAATFRQLSSERARFSTELQELAKGYGDHIKESGSMAAAMHRGWLTLKDALTGSDPKAVLQSAEQGEDHAVKEYQKALAEDISPGLRTVVQRQFTDIKAGHDRVRSLRDAHV